MPAVLADTRSYQRAMQSLKARVYADTAVCWRLLDLADLDRTFPGFAAALAAVVVNRRRTAVAAADVYYRAVRTAADAAGLTPTAAVSEFDLTAFAAELRLVSVVSVKAATGRGQTFGQSGRNSLVRSMGVADKWVQDAARDRIRALIEADPECPGWRRRTVGTCDYCREQAAGEHVHPGEADFPRHPHCGCQPEPDFAASPRLEPEEEYVENILDALRVHGDAAVAELNAALANPELAALSRLNVETALQRFAAEQAERQAAAAASQAARVSPDAFLSETQYEALRPASAWSEERRRQILAALRETPEGRVLADTLERFQDGGNIARLRTKIERFLNGEAIEATSRARAEALLNAIRNAPEWAPDTLYRGMVVKGKLENVLARYNKGDILDLNLTSFSSDRAVAARFQQMTAKGGSETRVMVQLVGDGKRAIPIQNLPADRRLFREKEWLSAGRYEIVEVRKQAGGIFIKIRQVGPL